jgi:tetratricopeptide (TPR) repeat protein
MHMFDWLRKIYLDRDSRDFISWLGGGAVVVVAGIWAVFVYFDGHDSDPSIRAMAVVIAAQQQIIQMHDKAISPELLQKQIDQLQSRLAQIPQGNDEPLAPEVREKRDHLETLLKITQTQLQAVQQIDEGDFDQAIVMLRRAEASLDGIFSEDSVQDLNQRGFDYKTFAQAYQAKGDDANAQRYMEFAISIFKQIGTNPKNSKEDIARAIKGIANIEDLRGNTQAAIEDLQRAIRIFPATPYAWYDLFIAYAKLPKHDAAALAAMREALSHSKQNDALTPEEIDRLNTLLARSAQ